MLRQRRASRISHRAPCAEERATPLCMNNGCMLNHLRVLLGLAQRPMPLRIDFASCVTVRGRSSQCYGKWSRWDGACRWISGRVTGLHDILPVPFQGDANMKMNSAMTADHDRSSEPHALASGLDVLSEMLRAVRLTGAMLFLVEQSAPWLAWAPRAESFRRVVLPAAQHLISFHIVTHGCCWGGLMGGTPERLETGDVLVIPHGDAYFLADPPGAERTYDDEEAVSFFRDMAAGRLPPTVMKGGDAPHTSHIICGFLGCDLRPFNPVLSALPQVLRVRPPTAAADSLPHLVAFAVQELREDRSASQVVRLRMAELLFIDVMRRYLEALPGGQTGWLAGLRDPVVARALGLLHDSPARCWTLDALATQAGTSRSVLAERFVHLIGQPPMQYLRELRMQLACRLLVEDGAKVVSVAATVGFESEAAFSRAFKKCVGVSPDEWRRKKVW
jgi:AraC-like DNA-binding protein